MVPELVPDDLYLNLHPELGDSLYTVHSDGSGMAISSRHRPILNMRPNAALSAFADDGWILSFLKARDLDCDVLTDEDLDREGAAALDGYDLVLTGNHPEYVSTRMWDALTDHLGRGGHLAYLGGNGFYWRVAFHDEVPGVIELRRAEDGSRPWEAEPGEYYHAFTGEYGGMWRRVGRPPQTLLGVGFSASGFDVSRPYTRMPGAERPEVAFLFDGVPETVIGDFGIAGGGAAGQEIDRFDAALGSPAEAIILATATGHTEEMMISKEDMPAANYMIGAPDNPLCRADMVWFATPSGGTVFSTGSIAWAAALPHGGFAIPSPGSPRTRSAARLPQRTGGRSPGRTLPRKRGPDERTWRSSGDRRGSERGPGDGRTLQRGGLAGLSLRHPRGPSGRGPCEQ